MSAASRCSLRAACLLSFFHASFALWLSSHSRLGLQSTR
jgi:hypothetical protein